MNWRFLFFLPVFFICLAPAILLKAQSKNDLSRNDASRHDPFKPDTTIPLIANPGARHSLSLDGPWQYLIDPYETGFYDYRYQERSPGDPEAYWNSDIPKNKTDRKEHGFIDKYTLTVPGDWNAQDPKFLYYEGTVWYKRSFDYQKADPSGSLVLYFGAVNYKADVYLNGRKLGVHKGGFTPFNFAVPDSVIKPTGNFLVVKVNNKRYADEIPTLNTDWWNYGGITREVKLIELPGSSPILDYSLQLKTVTEVEGWVSLKQGKENELITVEIPDLKIKQSFPIKQDTAHLHLTLPSFQSWSPENPKCYTVIISGKTDRVEEKIGFRTIRVQGKKILLNGKPVFLRGISIHEEIAGEKRRAHSREDAIRLLSEAKELGCNMVRLAHYPHNEQMVRVADSLGLLVWSEIPVYWTIDFSSKAVLDKAKTQLDEMITRDRNRASVIIWSVGNETPVSPPRTEFLRTLLQNARAMDPTRLVSAALEVNYLSSTNTRQVDDPLGQYVDLVAFNEYLGWYGGSPEACRTAVWTTKYDKPVFISETGAEAVAGFHADSLTLWSEEFQEWYYQEQVNMLKRMPDNFAGISPWILSDFRSPRRNNPVYQDGWNKKGLIDPEGKKKKAFFVLKKYYEEMKTAY
ncbi:glycoside hydrolase family 2 protein [Flavitalea flava]